MKLPTRVLIVLLLFVLGLSSSQAQDLSVIASEEDLPESTEPELKHSGNFIGKWFYLYSNKDSAPFNIQFYNQADELQLSYYRAELYYNGDYVNRNVGFHLKTHVLYRGEDEVEFSLLEGYNSLNIAYKYAVMAGKRRYTWGKGYAWNPVGYINSEKDPVEPQLIREGRLSSSFEYIKSFNSNKIRTMSFDFVVLPPPPEIKNVFGSWNKTVLAAKMYSLLYDTDIDIMSSYSEQNPKQIGMDVSRNIQENIEIHGELSYFMDKTRYLNRSAEPYSLYSHERNGFSYLAGLRYLTSVNLTLLCEYYHDDAGMTESEFTDHFNYLRYIYRTGDNDLIQESKEVIWDYFSAATLGRNYLYVNLTQKEPFGVLYLTVSPAMCIYNVDDSSMLLIHELNYKPFTNYEMILRAISAFGTSNSEFANRGPKRKIEFWLSVYF